MTNGTSSGEGRIVPGNDARHAGFAYSRWTVMGRINDTEEGDLSYTTDPAVSIGAAYGHSSGQLREEGSSENIYTNAISADANLKYRGLSLHNEFFWRENERQFSDDGELFGFYTQSGYFVIPKKLEFAARYAYADCDNGKYGGRCTDYRSIDQASASLNYFFFGHSLKAQLGYDFLRHKPVDTTQGSLDAHKMGLTLVGWW